MTLVYRKGGPPRGPWPGPGPSHIVSQYLIWKLKESEFVSFAWRHMKAALLNRFIYHDITD